MVATRPRALNVLGAVLLALGLLAAPAAPTPALAVRPGEPGRAYLLRGGDAAGDNAAADALRQAGFTVEVGVETPDFTGAQANLSRYDLVLALYNANIGRSLSPAGASALARFVERGGGLITGEWLTWQSASLGLAELAALLPATSCGINTATSTTFTELVPNPVIGANLPDSFGVTLANLSGSEGCLEPRDEAAVLYTSSNGGGRPGSPGLVIWNPPNSSGRVASFSTLLSGAELASPAMRRLLQNTAMWVGEGRDLTPPTIRAFTLSGAGTLTSSRDVTIDVRANDRGGARLGSYYVVEYTYSGDPNNPWRVAQRSDWVAWGNGANRSIPWRLTDEAGAHYLQLFLADRAGNVSSTPGLDFISYQPAVATIALDQQRIYHLRPAAGSTMRVRLDVVSGNPDLYVFTLDRDGLSFHPGSDQPVEQVDIASDGGIYQVEVEGHIAGSYRLSAAPASAGNNPPRPNPRVRARSSIITIRSVAPEVGDADLPAPPAEEGPAVVGRIIYLPLLTR